MNKCAPGDEITVVGIVEMRNVEQKGSAPGAGEGGVAV